MFIQCLVLAIAYNEQQQLQTLFYSCASHKKGPEQAGKPMSQDKGTQNSLHLELPFPGSSGAYAPSTCFADPQCQSSSIPLECARPSLPVDREQNPASSIFLAISCRVLVPLPLNKHLCSTIPLLQYHPHIWRSTSGHSVSAASIWSHRKSKARVQSKFYLA